MLPVLLVIWTVNLQFQPFIQCISKLQLLQYHWNIGFRFSYFKTIGTVFSKFQLLQYHLNIKHKPNFPGPCWHITAITHAHGLSFILMLPTFWTPYSLNHAALTKKLPSSLQQLNDALPRNPIKARNLSTKPRPRVKPINRQPTGNHASP